MNFKLLSSKIWRKSVKYYFSLILLLTLITPSIFCQPEEDTSKILKGNEFETIISSEEYKGDKYINYGVGFEISKIKEWFFAPMALIEQRRKMLAAQSEKNGTSLSGIWQPLITITKYPYGKPVDYSPKITISVLDLEMWPGIENAYDAAKSSHMRKKSKKYKGKIKNLTDIKEIEVNGQSCAYFEYDYKKRYRGEKKNFHYLIARFVYKRKQFSIQCKSLKKDFKKIRKDCLDIIRSVKFFN